MDANNRESSADVNPSGSVGSSSTAGAAARMKKTISDRAADAKEAVNDLSRKAADKWDNSRQSAADALERTAGTLHSSADQVSDLGHTAAERVQTTAEYFRETDFQGIMEDFQDMVRRYPAQSIAAAAIAGFLLARGLRNLTR